MTSPFARKKQRKPAAEERRIKAERRSLIFEVMSYDSMYHRKGDYIDSIAIAIMLEITPCQAAHCLTGMNNDFLIDPSKRVRHCSNGSHLANVYRLKQKSMMSTAWRKNSNQFTRLDNYRFLGAVI
jgi:hypothetical protein